MRFLAGLVVVGLVGCESPRRTAPDAASTEDAATDGSVACRRLASPHPNPVSSGSASIVPFTTTGTTPAGSLDDVRYLGVAYVNGDCGDSYLLDLYRTSQSSDYEAVVQIQIRFPFTEVSPGTIAASAIDFSCATSEQVRFEVTHIDPPQAPEPLRIAGRVTVNDGAWNLDFTLDATTQIATCI